MSIEQQIFGIHTLQANICSRCTQLSDSRLECFCVAAVGGRAGPLNSHFGNLLRNGSVLSACPARSGMVGFQCVPDRMSATPASSWVLRWRGEPAMCVRMCDRALPGQGLFFSPLMLPRSCHGSQVGQQEPKKPLCACLVGFHRGVDWRGVPLLLGCAPHLLHGQTWGWAAITVLLHLLQLCSPALLMAGVDMAKARAHTFILHFQQIIPGKSPNEDHFP